jgi:hypothetical protein
MKQNDIIYLEKYRQRLKVWTECYCWFSFLFLVCLNCEPI